MKVYCYKTLKYSKILIPFKKGQWYPFYKTIYDINGRPDPNSVAVRKTPNSTVTMDMEYFNRHFYTLSQVRKLKLKQLAK